MIEIVSRLLFCDHRSISSTSRMNRILLKILSVALFAPLGAAADVRFDQYQKSASSWSAIASNRIVADKSHHFKIRTITAGVNLKDTTDLATIESAVLFLQKAR